MPPGHRPDAVWISRCNTVLRLQFIVIKFLHSMTGYYFFLFFHVRVVCDKMKCSACNLCAIYFFLNVQQLNYGRCRDGSGRHPDGSGRLLVGPVILNDITLIKESVNLRLFNDLISAALG